MTLFLERVADAWSRVFSSVRGLTRAWHLLVVVLIAVVVLVGAMVLDDAPRPEAAPAALVAHRDVLRDALLGGQELSSVQPLVGSKTSVELVGDSLRATVGLFEDKTCWAIIVSVEGSWVRDGVGGVVVSPAAMADPKFCG